MASEVDMAAVSEFWKRFDLDGRRHKLDQQALDMRSRHEAGAGSRRALAEATKAFRSGTDAAKLAGLKPLLRKYQEEIDGVTRRARHAERAFRDLFRALAEAPDPHPALQRAYDDGRRKAELEADVTRLRAEVAEYEQEFAALKNQDITIRQLEERLRGFEEDVERQVEDMVREREAELRATADQEMAAAATRETQRDKALQAAESDVAAANQRADDAQTALLEMRARYDDDTEAFRSQLEVLAQESDRANARVLALTRELEATRAGRDAGDGGGDAGGAGGGAGGIAAEQLASHVETTKRLIEAEAEVARQRQAMREATRQWEKTIADANARAQEAEDDLRQDIADKQAAIDRLNIELSKRVSDDEVADLRRQLHNLQALHFNVEDEDGAGGSDAKGSDATASAQQPELRAALARARQLQSSVVTLRRERDDGASQIAALQQQLNELQATVDAKDALVNQLEGQLATATTGTAVQQGTGAPAGMSTAGTAAGTPSATGTPGAPASPAPSALQLSSVLNSRPTGSSASTADAGAVSVVDILRGQRDRFRAKVLELEKQGAQMRKDVAAARARESRLTDDNVRLFEKVRYLESYARGAGTGAGAGAGALSAATPTSSSADRSARQDIESGGTGGSARRRDNVEARYSRMYEDSVNPFTEFSRREKARRYADLNAPDKITLGVSRFFLSNKYARQFLFFYVLCLHCLVFSTLFHFVHKAKDNCS